jgi:hypothetical protein
MFGAVNLALLPMLLLAVTAFANRYPSVFRSGYFLLFLALIFWTVLWLSYNIFVTPVHSEHMALAATLSFWAGMFCVGLLLPLHSRRFKKVLWVAWAGMIVLAALTFDATQFQSVGSVTEGVATYQQTARSMLVTSAMMIATTPKAPIRIGVAAASFATLFVLGGRSELVGLVAAYTLMEFLLNRRSAMGRAMLSLGILTTLGFIASNLQILQASRQLEILHFTESGSWLARVQFLRLALGQISESPLLGVYGGHRFFGEGAYAHNILSAWVSLGLPGFLIYLSLSFGCAWTSLRLLIEDVSSRSARMATLMNTSAIILVLFSKSVYWELPPFAWATLLFAIAHSRMKLRLRPLSNKKPTNIRNHA